MKVKHYKCQKCNCRVDPNRISIWDAQKACAKGIRDCGMRDVLVEFNRHQNTGVILLEDKRQKPHLTQVKPTEKKPEPKESDIAFELPDPIYLVIKTNGKVKHK